MLDRKDATAATAAFNETFSKRLPHDDGSDFALAQKGFIKTTPNALVTHEMGHPVWDMGQFSFIEDKPAPATVNPSLWRQARLNTLHGLFEVVPGIYQVRNFDLSNITFIEGDTGIIVIDPLISSETARVALELYRSHRGDRPVTAVIYTHSHVDHYGGVKGVLTDEEAASGGVRIIAPDGFLEEAVSENVLAGNAMSRRATYMYGALLPRDEKGHVDSGLGKTVSLGSISLVPPNEIVYETGTKLDVDGVEIVFQYTPDTEAPAEMNFYFPQMKALCMAENCSCHLHNIYTPRGAQVRDAKSWSYYIDEAIALFANEAEVLFASHHWPRWGKQAIVPYLKKQRDMYKYVHDQTLRLANHGLTAIEIAEKLKMPPTLEAEWYTRGYYGTLNHNAKAVYQRYLGWFDGNPANLHPLPPEDAAKKYVEFMGGPVDVLAKARAAFENGEYRWVAEVVNHLVFADPSNEDARLLQADAFEQLGYQAESGPWRAFYLTGAMELRAPRAPSDEPRTGNSATFKALPAEQLLDALSVRLNGEMAGDQTIEITLQFTDTSETYLLVLENAVLHHYKDKPATAPALTAKLAKTDLAALALRETDAAALMNEGKLSVDGEIEQLTGLIELLDQFDFWFEIVMP